MATPKRQRRDAPEAAAAAASLAALSDEVLIRTLTFADKRDVGAAASACRRWHAVVHGEASAPLWRGLVAAHHPSLLEAAPAAPPRGWRDLFLRTARRAALIDARLRAGLARHVKGVREEEFLIGRWHPRIRGGEHPYPSPTKGTTATATPNANGFFPRPVYYDWGANWDRVSALVPTKPVQAALKRSVDEAEDEDGYYFDSWDEGKVWPFLFNIHRRIGNGEQNALFAKFLPREHVLEMNGRVAEWFRARGERFLSEEYRPRRLAELWAKTELKSGVEANEDLWAEDDARALTEELDLDLLYEEGHDVMLDVEKSSEAVLYNKDSPLRETLLCTPQNTWAFMPLNYALAKMLSPKDAELKVYASEDYSVVVDERRNIVFDNYWYFYGKSASRVLKESRDKPQLRTFDYSLGGLAN